MKTWTLKFRAVDKNSFEELRRGIKALEKENEEGAANAKLNH